MADAPRGSRAHGGHDGERRRFEFLSYVLGVAGMALVLGRLVPLLGPAVIALLVGAVLSVSHLVPYGVRSQAGPIGAKLLQLSIVALGLSVNVVSVITVARSSLAVMLGTLLIGLGGIWMLGRALRVGVTVAALLTVGTSVCGASAIAAVAPVIDAGAVEVAYAVSVVFVFNVVAVVAFPAVAHLFGFSAGTFAVWAGTAINDTSSVLAAGFAFGQGAAATAAVVKLSRTVMIVPITLGLAMLMTRKSRLTWRARITAATHRGLPWFIVAFLAASVANSIGLVPRPGPQVAAQAAQLGTVLALATIGLSADLRVVQRAGLRPLILGLVGWLLLAGASLALQAATRTI